MIEIILPYSNNLKFYEKLNELSKQDLLFTTIKFSNLYGNFPWSFWSGNKNTNYNNNTVILEEKIKNFNKNSFLPLILDISNINLSEQDLADRKLNMILKELNNGANKISCSDLNIINILKKKYPYYDYIFSENASLTFPINNEILEVITEQEELKGIILDNKLVDKNFNFSEVKNKSKIYIKIGSSCNKECINYKQCLTKEHELQYFFSENSILETCKYTKNLYKNLNIREEIEYYNKLGYTNFIIDSPLNKIPVEIYNLFLLLNLKKENDDTILKEVYLKQW